MFYVFHFFHGKFNLLICARFENFAVGTHCGYPEQTFDCSSENSVNKVNEHNKSPIKFVNTVSLICRVVIELDATRLQF